ncbi:unnamed protein product [Onchocerca flexuosa]|uniref:Protein kinase domain-containing protein n=1 Tax=Onchocerca flexuosa TaxID=387005 RepID=A0A183I294_9BILA|nr:unnamed protein product [Onchocerca flexuosa]
MDRKEVRHNDIQPETIRIREHLSAELQPDSLSPSSTGTLLVHPPKLLTEVHRQECTELSREECPSATSLPMHILQQYRDEEKVPMFLVKMWNILEDPEFQNIICWDKV